MFHKKKFIMDFIIKLLKSKDLLTKILYNLVIMIINKLIEDIHFVLFKKKFNAKQFKSFLLIKLYNIKMYHKKSLIIKVNFLCLCTGQL